MKTLILSIALLAITPLAWAQNIEGVVYDKQTGQTLPGVNVYWVGTNIGTSTDLAGKYTLKNLANQYHNLAFSSVGFTSDTIHAMGKKTYDVYLEAGKNLDEVTVSERVNGTAISKLNPILVQNISSKELTKFACCNLSESFETNASVDVAYADAVSGIKQIKLLGLSGGYSQLLFENIPIMRGAENAFGLENIPGTWIQSIQVSKGAASLKNGYESTTGQINVQLKEPDGLERFNFYAYANQDGKTENNLMYAQPVGDKWSTSLLTHWGTNWRELDMNHDGFLDKPMGNQVNLMNRWNYKHENLSVKLGVWYLTDQRRGGQPDFDFATPENTPDVYGIDIDINRFSAFAKVGYNFKKPATSLGVILWGNRFNRNSFYGLNHYNTQQTNVNANVLFQSYLFDTRHTYTTGASLNTDLNNDKLNGTDIGYNETVGGAFFEYNFIPSDNLSVLAGVRYDYSTLWGSILTPRVHAKYHFPSITTLRVSAGKGHKTTSFLAPNTALLASSRQLIYSDTYYHEEAWNYGISMVNDLPFYNRKLQLSLEFFRTDFSDQLIVDLNQNAREAVFTMLNGPSYSNSAQIELFIEPFERFEVTTAFRVSDVKTTYTDHVEEAYFVNHYKGMLSGQYRTRMDKWQFDATLQLMGQQRIPSTLQNSVANQRPEVSEPYLNLIAQITKNYRNWSFYVGGENLTGFTQANAIIDPQNPFGNEFDASMVWGPLYGAMWYAGVKYVLNKK